MKRKIAVVLAGCGVYDGAEIHEATLSLLAIARRGAEYRCFAPDINQSHVVNHLTGKATDEVRNVLVESARIARGKISPLSEFRAGDFDALLFPGGFGVAKNLCDYAFKGVPCTVNGDVERAVRDMAKAGKPVGALCIAPVMVAAILGDVELTAGSDPHTAESIRALGAKHHDKPQGAIVIDRLHKVVSAPCYMLDSTIDQIAEDADNVVAALLSLI